MGFLAVCTALYDYQPQAENELEITEGELLYILEKSTEDDWWKAKKRAKEDEDDEPVGLIPNNYVEEVSGFRADLGPAPSPNVTRAPISMVLFSCQSASCPVIPSAELQRQLLRSR